MTAIMITSKLLSFLTGYLTNYIVYKKFGHHFYSIFNHTDSGARQVLLRVLLCICARCAARFFHDGNETDIVAIFIHGG